MKCDSSLNLDAANPRVDSPGKPVPTKGHVIDHIRFEINHLEAFCKALAASSVKFDQPYSQQRHKDFASAELTDPCGTSIEPTEGLNKFEQKCACRREAHSRLPADEDGWARLISGTSRVC